MKAACSHCGTEHILKASDVGAHSAVRFCCSKCGKSTIVENKQRLDATMVISPLPSFARANASGSNMNFLSGDDGLHLPQNACVMLTVLTGPAKGASHTFTKPRISLGREGADVELADGEISRLHCLLEVRDLVVNLKDMDSTNGTFFAEERVRAAILRNGDEFRIGDSVLRLTIEPR